MSKFTENAFAKLMAARNEGQVEKALATSCEMCASRYLMTCTCDRCPIQAAAEIKIKNMKLFNELMKKD